MMIRVNQLGEDVFPELQNVPGQTDPGVEAAAKERERRKRIMIVGGLVLGGIVLSGSLALAFFAREKRTHVDRNPLREGQVRCIGHVKYSVGHMGRLTRVGSC